MSRAWPVVTHLARLAVGALAITAFVAAFVYAFNVAFAVLLAAVVIEVAYFLGAIILDIVSGT